MIRNEPDNKNRWIRLAFLGLIWLLIWSLYKDLLKVKRGFGRIDEVQERLVETQNENLELKQRMTAVETGYYQERVMRDKLNLQLPGETVVVLPAREGGEGRADKKNDTKEWENWEKWWNVVK